MEQLILDYDFSPGEFAIAVGFNNSVRVKILGSIYLDNYKYYIITGPKDELISAGWDGKFLDDTKWDFPIGWMVDIADPDELELCSRHSHLRLIKGD